MLENLKELGFIPESRAIKLYKKSGSTPAESGIFGERYDRVTYLSEKLPDFEFTITGAVYVEACRFLPLLPFIRSATATANYLEVVLNNTARYKLPYLDVDFECPAIEGDSVLQMSGVIDLSILKKTALQNLVKPEMRCIYVDQEGAVSCNFLQGTVDSSVVSNTPLLLPPDLIDYMGSAEDGKISTTDAHIIYTDGVTKWIWAPKSELSEEDEEKWYFTIRNSARSIDDSVFTSLESDVLEALKRLQYFGNEAVFNHDKITVEENFEPVIFPTAHGGTFALEEVISVLPYGKKIAFSDSAMFIKNGSVTILVSEREEE